MKDPLYSERSDPETMKALQEYIVANSAKIEGLPNYQAVRAAVRRLARGSAGKKVKQPKTSNDLLNFALAQEGWKMLGLSAFELRAISLKMLEGYLDED
jgi:hypothetical protein